MMNILQKAASLWKLLFPPKIKKQDPPKICKTCGISIYENGSFSSLEYTKYKEGIINYLYPVCQHCYEDNLLKFHENICCCPACGKDISESKSLVHCDICGIIGHYGCFHILAADAGTKWLYPHLHNSSSHESICNKCADQINSKAQTIKQKFDTEWVGGSRYENIKGFKIIKTLGKVECKEKNLYEKPANVEENLKLRTVQLGGNAYLNCFWELQTEEYIKGYSRNDNPYYSTRRWFIGEAEAVVVEKFKNKKISGNKITNVHPNGSK